MNPDVLPKMVHRGHNQQFFTRTTALTVFLLLFCGLLGLRLIDLQVFNSSAARAQAEKAHSIYQKLLPSRGEIKITDKFSADPYTIATNIKHYLVYAVPAEIRNPNLTAASLASVLSMDSKDILPKLVDTGKKYAPIKRQLSDAEQAQITKLQLPGIFFDSEDARFYPENNLLSQVLGFVGFGSGGTDKVGLYGLEKYFQSQLAGKAGSLSEEKDSAGAWIFGSKRDLVPEVDGDNLILTIDKTIQFKAQDVLKNAVTAHGADSGSVTVINPKTGAILAMAGYPDFDPNNYNKAQDPRVFNNQPTTGNYEPGSTFKAITMAAAIDAGKITPQTVYTDTGSVDVDKYTIKNAEPGARGQQTMIQALDFSLNTGAIFVENLLGNNDFLKYVQAFGLGKRTGVTLPETTGDLSGLKGNVQVNYDTASFGQGISVTPLQMLQAYDAIANGGKMMKPYIVQAEISANGAQTQIKPQEAGQVITPQTANTVSAMLVDVVENGFGKKAAVQGYYLAGKTGTAQVAGTNGKYDPTNNIGSFIGFGPVENPQFLMIVRIDHPRDVQFAESTAGPAWGEMAKFILDYYNIAPTRPTQP